MNVETEEMESKETTVTDICLFMNELAPVKYAESWDNPGLLLGHLAQHVYKIMVALDLSPEVAEQAIEQECDIIITHHLLFQPAQDPGGNGYQDGSAL